jgi:YbgC/YbaW family acyl-CoA thioester hydrolase
VALIEYLRNLGYSYNDMLEEGFDMLYIDAHTAYKSPAYFDESLRVHCRAGKVGNTSVRFDFQIFCDDDQRAVASGEIVVVIAKRDTYQKEPVPGALRSAIHRFENEMDTEVNKV